MTKMKTCIICGRRLRLVERKYCIICSHNLNKAKKPVKKKRPRTAKCVCCGEKLERYQHKYCLSCSGLTVKICNRVSAEFSAKYIQPDTMVTSIIAERNLDRNCPVDKSIDCINCPLPECVLPEDDDD